MRVVFTTIPSYGHFHSVVPLAAAMRDQGHDVTVATAQGFAEVVERSGLAFAVAGLSEEQMIEHAAEVAGLDPSVRGLRMFAEIAAPAMAQDLTGLLAEQHVDLLVHEEGEWGGHVAAAAAGVRSVCHGWGTPFWTRDELDLIEAFTAPLWQRFSCMPGSGAGVLGGTYVDVCPPSLQSPPAGAAATTIAMRFEAFDGGGHHESVALPDDEAGPIAYVTLGTVPLFNRAPELLTRVIAATAPHVAALVVTVGPGNDPRALGPVPENVHAVSYARQSGILPRCSLAVTHGGAGSTLGALAAGVPVLVLPRGAPSQGRMADACVRAGAGRAVQPAEASVDVLEAEVVAVLGDANYAAAAGRVRDELRDLPAPAEVAQQLLR